MMNDRLPEMWQNFLHAKPLGAVILADDMTVWQKRGKFTWQRVGATGDYTPEDIRWPVSVLLDGME